MIGKTHRSVGPGRQLHLPGDVSLYRQINKTILILTWVVMFYHLAGQASAAEAPTTVGEIASSTSPVEMVKHDPVNFDQVDAKVTKPDVDSSIHPAAAQAIDNSNKNKVTSAVDGAVSASAEVVEPVVQPVVTTVRQVAYNAGSIVNRFPYGYCTWYVASKRSIPWTGNAGTWYGDAMSYGFRVGSTPAVGAVMVTRESYLGHVALVEAVNPDGSWVVSEMNYAGWGVISSRTIKPGTIPVVGFIY